MNGLGRSRYSRALPAPKVACPSAGLGEGETWTDGRESRSPLQRACAGGSDGDVSADWRSIEDFLNRASEEASEPFYSQIEAAKESLFRIGCAARKGTV